MSSDDPLGFIGKALADARLPYALIGGHAVNAYLAPRFTADIDITVQANPEALERLRSLLEEAGYRMSNADGAELSSGPDFIRFLRGENDPPIELQAAKTQFQDEIIDRAVIGPSSMAVATIEDLIVLKLIANRPKDLIDLAGLLTAPGVDWGVVEFWAQEWDVLENLARLRAPDG